MKKYLAVLFLTAFICLVCSTYYSVHSYSRYVVDEIHVLDSKQTEYIDSISKDISKQYGKNLNLIIISQYMTQPVGMADTDCINIIVDIEEKKFYLRSQSFKLGNMYEAYQQAKLRYYINSDEASKGIVNLYSNIAAEIYTRNNNLNELNDKGFFNEIERDIGIIHIIVLLTVVILFILYKKKIFKF